MPMNVAQSIDASDGFLAEIASLGKTDCQGISIYFLSEIVFCDVSAVQRCTIGYSGSMNGSVVE